MESLAVLIGNLTAIAFTIIIIVTPLFLIFIFLKSIYLNLCKKQNLLLNKDAREVLIDTTRKKWPYQKKKYLLHESEKKFYNILKNAIDDNLVIIPKVRLADIVKIPREYKYNKSLWYKIQAKHVDFLLCNSYYLSPVMAIELDGSFHNTEEAKKNDIFKNEVFEDVGLPLLRVERSSYYDIEKLKNIINVKIYNK
jgi:hypothetical protein